MPVVQDDDSACALTISERRPALAEAIAFAAEGKVRAEIHKYKLDDVNEVLADLKAGKINGRAVLMM